MLSDVSVQELESLLAKKIVDPVRLQSIIDKMKKGKKFSDSDEMFIENLLYQYSWLEWPCMTSLSFRIIYP